MLLFSASCISRAVGPHKTPTRYSIRYSMDQMQTTGFKESTALSGPDEFLRASSLLMAPSDSVAVTNLRSLQVRCRKLQILLPGPGYIPEETLDEHARRQSTRLVTNSTLLDTVSQVENTEIPRCTQWWRLCAACTHHVLAKVPARSVILLLGFQYSSYLAPHHILSINYYSLS